MPSNTIRVVHMLFYVFVIAWLLAGSDHFTNNELEHSGSKPSPGYF